MQVRDIMTQSVETIDPYATLREAARKMEIEDIGFLPVLSDGEIVGVITDRDIAVRAVSRGLDPERTTVEETMTLDIVALSDTSDLEAASDLMRNRHVRRLVITDEDNLPVGVVSKDKVAMYLGVYGMDQAAVRDTKEFPPDFEPAASASDEPPAHEAVPASDAPSAHDTASDQHVSAEPGTVEPSVHASGTTKDAAGPGQVYTAGVQRGPGQPQSDSVELQNDVAKRAFDAEPWRRSG